MNEKHLNWCKSHDWGTTATLQNGSIMVWDEYEDKNQVFSEFSDLRDWAGY